MSALPVQTMTTALEVSGLSVDYGGGNVVEDLSLDIDKGEIVALLGPNGAGKTSALKAMAGLAPLRTGEVCIDGQSIKKLSPERRARSGLFLVPDDRGIFAPMTVNAHLMLAAHRRLPEPMEQQIRSSFPQLGKLWDRRAGSLSGGEAQMLSLAMALAAEPHVLMIDELSFGLAPLIVENLLQLIRTLADETGLAILLVEQLVDLALTVADRAVILRREVVLRGTAAEVAQDPEALRRAYFGQ
jgi:branched-chain amino acid transport system ATP-binding protein